MMRYALLISFASVIIFGCAQKSVPVAATPPPPPPAPVVVQGPDAIKIDDSTAILTPEAMVAVGQQTYTTKCGRCHGLKAVDHYTATQWEPIVNRMALKAHLDDAQKANVLAYVKANAKVI